jgi:thioredoxin-related protein
MKPKKIITISVVVVLLLFVYYSMNAAPLISDEKYTYISGLRWYNTFEEGQRVALEQNKPIFIYFWAIWCTYCEKLHTEVYPNPEINRILKEDYVLVAVDLDTNKKDAARFGATYPPKLVFITPDGEIITEIGGYVPAESLLPVLQNVKAFYQNRISSGGG